MTDLWRVYRDDEILGPMTPAEIRQALREGYIDPFDLVSREGSNIRVELVEVDEVFSLAGEAQEASYANAPQQGESLRANGPQYYQPSAGRSEPSADAPIRAPAKPRANRRQAKRFYLIDKQGRVLGPLSPSEIMSLFYRGILDKSVKVQKGGANNKRVGISQFIAVYAGHRVNALANNHTRIGLDPRKGGGFGHPSSAVLNELTRNIAVQRVVSSRWMPTLSIVGVGVIIGILAFVLSQFDWGFRGPSKRQTPQDRFPRRESQTPPVDETAPVRRDPRVPQERGAPKVQRPRYQKPRFQRPTNSGAGKIKRRQPTRLDRQTARPKRVPSKTKATVQRAPRPQPRRPVARAAPPGARPVPQRVVRPPPVVRRPAPIPKPKPKAAPRSVVAALAGKVGQVVTAGPLSFSKAELAACSIKCRLRFRDATGKSVVGVFFRGAYESQLAAKPGSATISGSLKQEGGEYVVYLKSVR